MSDIMANSFIDLHPSNAKLAVFGDGNWIIRQQKHFHPGGMAPSEWTRSVRDIRDTPVADYSVPGANTTRRIAYRPQITVLPCLLALSVYYCKRTLLHCGQLWPYIRMGSLGTPAKCKLVRKPHSGFHKHKAFRLSYSSLLQSHDSLPHNMACIIYVSLSIYIQWIWPQMVVEHNRRSIWSGSILRSLGRKWEDMILPGCDNQRNCADLGKNEWDQKLGQREFVFSLYDRMWWKWDDVYIPWGLPSMYSPSLSPPPLHLYLCTPAVAHWRFTGRPWSSELRDAVGGPDRVNSEMHFETEIEWTQRCTGRLGFSKFGDELAGYDRASLEEYMEAVDLEGGATAAETLFICQLVIVGM